MSSFGESVKRHSVLLFFILAFVISWGGVLAVAAPGGIPARSEQAASLFPFVFLAMLPGPSIAGILVTGLADGRAGFRELLSRLARWRVGARWYAIALLSVTLLAMAVLLALSLTSPEYLPGLITTDDKIGLLLMGIAVGLGAGFFEELGWTGFAVPKLRLTHGVLTTGLVVGILWGVWHLLTYFWGSGTSVGTFSLELFLPVLLTSMTIMPAYRVLMVWVYDHTESLLLGMLMHAGFAAGSYIVRPMAASYASNLIYTLVLAAVLWSIVAVVAVADRRQPSEQPLRRRAA